MKQPNISSLSVIALGDTRSTVTLFKENDGWKPRFNTTTHVKNQAITYIEWDNTDSSFKESTDLRWVSMITFIKITMSLPKENSAQIILNCGENYLFYLKRIDNETNIVSESDVLLYYIYCESPTKPSINTKMESLIIFSIIISVLSTIALLSIITNIVTIQKIKRLLRKPKTRAEVAEEIELRPREPTTGRFIRWTPPTTELENSTYIYARPPQPLPKKATQKENQYMEMKSPIPEPSTCKESKVIYQNIRHKNLVFSSQLNTITETQYEEIGP